MGGFVGATLSYIGKRTGPFNDRHSAPDNSFVRVPAYTEVDLRGGVNVGQFTIEAFARNLFDKRGLTDVGGFNGTTFPAGAAAPPPSGRARSA